MSVFYDFSTEGGTAVTEIVPLAADVTGVVLTVEFSDRSDFSSIRVSKTVAGAGKSVTFALTAADVDALAGGRYRVKSGDGFVYAIGAVHYTPAPPTAPTTPVTVGDSGAVANLAAVALSGSYADLTDKPVIPAIYTDTQAQAVAKSVTDNAISALPPVAKSGDYRDLSNKPAIPTAYTDAQAQAVAKAYTDSAIGSLPAASRSGSYADLANKPTIPAAYTDAQAQAVAKSYTDSSIAALPSVAKTGSYADLANKPVIPVAYTDAQAQAAAKTYTDNSIAALPAVAKTGNYADLANKPTIPAQMTGAQVAADSTVKAAFLNVIPALEGMPFTSYGHSYTDASHWANGIFNQMHYPHRTARRLNMDHDGNGRGGSFMQDVALDAMGNTDPNRRWTFGLKGAVMIDAVTNDANFSGTDPQGMNGWEQSLRSLIYFLSLESIWDDNAPGIFTYTGSWARVDSADFYGGGFHKLSTGQTGTCTVAFTENTGGTWVLGFLGLNGVGFSVDLALDGVYKTTYTSGNQCRQSDINTANNGTTARNYCPVTIPFTVPPGNHTVTITPTPGATNGGDGPFLDWMGRVSATPPKIFLPKAVYERTLAADATIDAYNARLTTVAASFPNTILVDTLTGWDKNIHIGDDLIHPTVAGHTHLTSRMVAAIVAAYS